MTVDRAFVVTCEGGPAGVPCRVETVRGAETRAEARSQLRARGWRSVRRPVVGGFRADQTRIVDYCPGCVRAQGIR